MRPLRSVLIGDVDHYPSEYIFGVNQGMTILGHWHRTVNVRQPIDVIAKVLGEVDPDLIWGHMLLWSPAGAAHTRQLLSLCADWRRKRGATVVLHDGDARQETRFPYDISAAVDVALCNHTADRGTWRIPQLHWPYFAFYQSTMASPHPEWACDLFFAGRVGEGIYTARTQLLSTLQQVLSAKGLTFRCCVTGPHTLFRTPEVAASATAVLGHGRGPEAPGWVDVRVFQYPGAGGVLLHDDVGGFLEPYQHYVPYKWGDLESILAGIEYARAHGAKLRQEAFRFVQARHSSVIRVQQVLGWLGLATEAP